MKHPLCTFGWLAEPGSVYFTEIGRDIQSWRDWVAVGLLMRAGYATEGGEMLHITHAGDIAAAKIQEMWERVSR